MLSDDLKSHLDITVTRMFAKQNLGVRKSDFDQSLASIAMHMSRGMIAGVNHDSKPGLSNDCRHQWQDKSNEIRSQTLLE